MFGVASGVAAVRQSARLAGLARLEAEAAALGLRTGLAATAMLREVARDLARAREIARSFAQRWMAGGAVRNGGRGSIERIAATETAEAFTSSRSAAVSRAAGYYKVWDAQLDKRTCRICAAADGTIVAATARFPDGEPGAVHPYCRCSWTLLTASEVGGGVLFIDVA